MAIEQQKPNYFEQFKVICKGIAEGKVIQYRTKGNDKWDDVAICTHQHQFNFDLDYYEFRVKKNTQTIRYQNFLMYNEYIMAWASNDIDSREDIESNEVFTRWIGDEQELTIDEVNDE